MPMPSHGRFRAQIQVDGSSICLGTHDTWKQAAIIENAERLHYGTTYARQVTMFECKVCQELCKTKVLATAHCVPDEMKAK